MSDSEVSISTPGLARAQPYAPPPDTGLDVVYQDDHLLAINKPAGLLSVPGRGPALQDCAMHRVQQRFPQALLVHRLDEATSGLLLFALSPPAQSALSRAFETRQVKKTYLAWVHGLELPSEGEIDAPIALDWPRRPLRRVDFIHGKNASTIFETLQKDEQSGQTLCRLEPETGRTHQLRLHMRHIGHPIVGDQLYGHHGDAASRLMLHAHSLTCTHPITTHQLALSVNAPF